MTTGVWLEIVQRSGTTMWSYTLSFQLFFCPFHWLSALLWFHLVLCSKLYLHSNCSKDNKGLPITYAPHKAKRKLVQLCYCGYVINSLAQMHLQSIHWSVILFILHHCRLILWVCGRLLCYQFTYQFYCHPSYDLCGSSVCCVVMFTLLLN